jgi:hypothetical protein
MYQLEKDNKVKVYRSKESTIKDTLIHDKNEPSYWTEYNRSHSLLGARLGTGESREYPERISYNPLTGLI